MNETKIDNNNTVELEEVTQDIKEKILSPFEEYRKEIRKRRGKFLLTLLVLVVEAALGFMIWRGVIAENLHYRVTMQVRNTITGGNELATGTYVGETDFGYFIGEGTFNFNSGTVYTGQWNNNQMDGLGVLHIPNEGSYEGEFLASEKSGHGKFTWDDGTVYDGEWQNDQMNGQGTYTSPDQVKYVGVFKDNQFWDGTCKFKNDTGTYTVTYKENCIDNLKVLFADGTRYDGDTDGVTFSGTGKLLYANGDTYTGSFEDGYRTGQGVYVWSNGETYDGTWNKDFISGSGQYTYADGGCAEGTFEENIFVEGSYKVVNSLGEYMFRIENKEPVAVEMKLKSGTLYTGEVQDGKLTGTANITYSNGDQYNGEVKDGCKSGQGSYVWSSGASYEGEWENDQMHGQGTYTYSAKEAGYKLIGTFKKGVPDGQCRYYKAKNKSYKTDWENGKCIKVYE